MLRPVKNYPALLHTQKHHKTLIVADLHLGWEANLAQKGIHIPSQTSKILQKLVDIIDTTTPETLVVLGDVKHTIAKAEPGEWKDVPAFFEALKTKVEDVQIVRGNHDGNLEPLLLHGMKMHPSTGIILDTLGLFHGHTWPSKRLLDSATLIMGHIHPTVTFRDAQGFQITTPVWIRVRIRKAKLAGPRLENRQISPSPPPNTKKDPFWKPKARQLLIMPCFNEFLGGRPLNKKSEYRRYMGPVLRAEAASMDKGDVYLLDGTYLGTVEQLRSFS